MSDRNSIIRSLVFTAILIISSACAIGAQPPAIYIEISDTIVRGCGPDTEIELSVYLTNFYDTVASFQLWFQLDRPDLVVFQTNLEDVPDTTRWLCTEFDGPDCIDSLMVTDDTTYFQCNEWDQTYSYCLDSTPVPPGEPFDFMYPSLYDFFHVDTIEVLAGEIDTAGTLISGWERVDSRSLSGYGTDLMVAGIANLPGSVPPGPPGIPPQQGGLLMTLRFELLEISDTLTDRTVNILAGPFLSGFFDFDGNPIGGVPVEVVDTICWVCLAWAGDVCLNWKRISVPPPSGCDSIAIVLDTTFVPDPDSIWYQSGSITIPPFAMGDFDADGQGPDIADLIYLVSYMFQGGPELKCVAASDCDGSGGNPNIADLICWVTWMFHTF
jgi:hypothetical protein